MEQQKGWNHLGLLFAYIVSFSALAGFLFKTNVILNPLVLVGISIFLLVPFQKESKFVKRVILLISIIFAGWILSDLGFALFPFGVAFLLAYLLDPLVSFLEQKRIPRWTSALSVIIIFMGIVSLVAIFIFPLIFDQLNDAIPRISSLVSSLSTYLSSDKFYNTLAGMGFPKETLKSLVESELIPRLENLFTIILQGLLSLLTNLSTIATQLVNAVLIPILLFYFLKDFTKLKRFISSIFEKKNQKLLNDFKRINKIMRIYLTLQAIEAVFVATVVSITFSIFGLPYPIVLGLICGIMNPIPFLGLFASMSICTTAVLLVNPTNMLNHILVIFIVICALHIINAYFLEPNIAGKRVGLHPILLIASLFVFGGMFGIVGFLIAVPSTAILMMFFNDWRQKLAKTIEPEPLVTEGQVTAKVNE